MDSRALTTLVAALDGAACAPSQWTALCADVLDNLRVDCARVLGAGWIERLRAVDAEYDEDSAALCSLWERSAVDRAVVVSLGQTATPASVTKLLLARLPPLRRPMRRVLDPACGSGLLIGAAARRVLAEHCRGDSSPERLAAVLSELSAALTAYDIDDVSCVTTRLNLMCASVPLLQRIALSDPCMEWRLPTWTVVHGSATDLFRGDSAARGSGARDAAGAAFDIVLMNPPFRNKQRELGVGGTAFDFLRQPAWRAADAAAPHHNLYGYFLRLALGVCRSTAAGEGEGAAQGERSHAREASEADEAELSQVQRASEACVVAVVLRNMFDLAKYPGDVHFHRELVASGALDSVALLDGDAFAGLPRAARHDSIGIASCVVVLRPGRRAALQRPLRGVDAAPGDQLPPPSVSTLELRGGAWVHRHDADAGADADAAAARDAPALRELGLGALDRALRRRIGDAAMRSRWEAPTVCR